MSANIFLMMLAGMLVNGRGGTLLHFSPQPEPIFVTEIL